MIHDKNRLRNARGRAAEHLPRRRPSGDGAYQFLTSLSNIQHRIEAAVKAKPVPLVEGLGAGLQTILRTAERGHKLMFVGNGGSAAIASHMALDFWNAGGIDAVTFNDPIQLTCMSNDRGYEQVFAEPIRRFARLGDTLVAVSSSGRSPNILNAVQAAKAKGCEVITLTGFDANNALRRTSGLNFYVPSSSYGVVELSHLWLLVSMLEEIIQSRKSDGKPV